MDKIDLRLLYKQETGRYVADDESLTLPERGLLTNRTQRMMRYIDWLEDKITQNELRKGHKNRR